MFNDRGGSQYGGDVANGNTPFRRPGRRERAGADAPLIAAALLHDTGHLLHELPAGIAPDHGVDDVHEVRAAEWLAGWLPAKTVEPVRLHVAAKQYLCATDPDYFSRLTPQFRAWHCKAVR